MNQLIALAGKDLKLLLRDRIGFFFTFFFPMIYCIFFGTIFASQGRGSGKLRVLVVDEDRTDGSQRFIDTLGKSGEFDIEIDERESAADRVRRGDRTAFIALPKGFGEARERMFWGDPVTIQTGIDPSRQAEAGMIQGVLAATVFRGMQDLFSNPELMIERSQAWTAELRNSPNLDPGTRRVLEGFFTQLESFMKAIPKDTDGPTGIANASWEPFRIESVPIVRKRIGPKNPYEVSFPQGIIWGVMGCAAGFGISLVTERTRGTLIRLRISPVSRAQILGGKALACFATAMTLQIVLIGLGVLVFRIRPWSPGLLAVALLCVSAAFVGIMMLLSVLGKTEQAAGGIGWGVLVIMAMIGGGMIPQMFMPAWLQQISVVSPIRWAIQAMDGAIWRQYSVTEMAVPCAVLLGFGAVCFGLGVRAFRWTDSG
jgi:ABC-2 type transport system permease protein